MDFIRRYVFRCVMILFMTFSFFQVCAQVRRGAKKDKVVPVWLRPGPVGVLRTEISEKRFVIIIASYNNKRWYTHNLDSVFAQRYKNYRVIYIDDCSSDGTGKAVAAYLKKKKKRERVTLVCNTEHRNKAANLYQAIHSCDDNEIIVILDGDDWFAHCDVLAYLSQLYTENDIWMTYGGFNGFPNTRKSNYCREIPELVVKTRTFRSMRRITAALRTFYAWLYKHIKLEDLLYKGKFMPTTGDVAKMYPMFEMSGHRFQRIKDTVYVYNMVTPLNDFKIHADQQMAIHWFVVDKQRYPLLEQPGLRYPYKNNVDVIIGAENQESVGKQIESLKKYIVGISHIYVVTYNQQLQTSDQYTVMIMPKEQPITEVLAVLNKYHQISDFVLMINEDDSINKHIDLEHCAYLLQKTYASGFYLNVNRRMFLRSGTWLPHEPVFPGVLAWQFAYGPEDPTTRVRSVLMRRDDMVSILSTRQENTPVFSPEQVGLFFEEQALTLKERI